MSAPIEVIDLIQRFRRNLADYRSGKYNETQVRLEFIDPLFEALAAARPPAEKQVLQLRIETTDRQIDALVYELYGLTEEEIRIIENG